MTPAPCVPSPPAARSRPRYLRACLVALVAACIGLAAAASELGLPPILNYGADDYGGGAQNWAVVQADNGLVYFGNGDRAVLEFDGVGWRRIWLPHPTTVLSLAVGADGRVFVGARSELGYLEADAQGTLQYRSLLPLLDEDDREFGDVRRIHAHGSDVYFFTPQALYRLRDGAFRVWRLESGFHLSFMAGDRLFARAAGRGLLEFTGETFVPVPGGERYSDERIYAIVPRAGTAGGQEFLIGTSGDGLHVMDDHGHFAPMPTPADAFLRRSLIYAVHRSASGALAIGTLQGGLAILDRSGHPRWLLDGNNGLGNNTVLAIAEDRERGLWMAQDVGISRVAPNDPFTRFDQRNGLIGTVLAIHRHQGQLLVGTTAGLFRLETSEPGNARFQRLQEFGTFARAMLTIDDRLLVASITGVHEISSEGVRHVFAGVGVNSMLRSEIDPDRIHLGISDGLRSLRRIDGLWQQESFALTTGEGGYSLFERPDGELWVGTMGRNVFRVRFPLLGSDGSLDGAVVQRLGAEHGLVDGTTMVHSIGGEPLFATNQGVMVFDEQTQRFREHALLHTLFAEGTRSVGPLYEDGQGRAWLYSQDGPRGIKELGLLHSTPDGGVQLESAPFRSIAGHTYTALHVDEDGVAWFGSENVMFRYDPRAASAEDVPFHTLIRRVLDREANVVYGGHGSPPPHVLPSDANALRFEFAAPRFDHLRSLRYQVRLDGVDGDWSPWRAETYRDYTQIPAGNHRFRVRAQDVHGRVSEEAVFEFRLMPPWYMAWWAWLAYALLAIALSRAAFGWRSAALSRHNRKLAALVKERTQQLSEANQALHEQSITDPLTGLMNRRFLLAHIQNEVALVDRTYESTAGPDRPENADLVFLMVDIDHFKEINDRFGHAAGDRVLEQFRDILLHVARKSDTPVRWGGEEFLIVARRFSADRAHCLAERVRSAVESHRFDLGNGQHIHRTCSIGFAGYPVFTGAPSRLDWEKVVELADQCLYQAKRDGRNRWFGVAAACTDPPDDLDACFALGLPALTSTGLLRLQVAERPGQDSPPAGPDPIQG